MIRLFYITISSVPFLQVPSSFEGVKSFNTDPLDFYLEEKLYKNSEQAEENNCRKYRKYQQNISLIKPKLKILKEKNLRGKGQSGKDNGENSEI